MADILQTIAQSTRERITREKERVPLEQLKARPIPAHPSLYEALKAEPLAFLCEVKKASPSKGVIAPVFDPVGIAKAYKEAGASAISCLTEPAYFQGSDAALEAICQAVDVPVLRKDFVVDEYMIVQAAVMGAAGVLLIVELLTPDELRRAIALANQAGHGRACRSAYRSAAAYGAGMRSAPAWREQPGSARFPRRPLAGPSLADAC